MERAHHGRCHNTSNVILLQNIRCPGLWSIMCDSISLLPSHQLSVAITASSCERKRSIKFKMTQSIARSLQSVWKVLA